MMADYKRQRGNTVFHLPTNTSVPIIEQNGSVHAADPDSMYGRELQKWLDAGGVPDPADPEPAPPTPLDYGTVNDALDDRARMQQAVDLFKQYIGMTGTPTEAQRKQFENMLARVNIAILRRLM